MPDELRRLLWDLTALQGVSGDEGDVAHYVRQRTAPFTHRTDNLGNVTVHVPGRRGAPTVAVVAHLDEVGLVIRAVEPNGFLRAERLGGVNPDVLPGLRLRIRTATGSVDGVVGAPSPHVTADADRRPPALAELTLDVGAASAEEVAARGIAVGDTVSFVPEWTELGDDLVAAKSLDNRLGVAILLALLHDLQHGWDGPDLHLIFSVQEEFTVRGALPAVRRIEPDVCLGLDITVASDTPDAPAVGTMRVGGGPAITFLQFNPGGTLAGVAPHRPLTRHLVETAERLALPFQREVAAGVINESAFLAFEGTRGIITGGVSLPTRYTHSPVEVASLSDARHAVTLLREAVASLPPLDQLRPDNT